MATINLKTKHEELVGGSVDPGGTWTITDHDGGFPVSITVDGSSSSYADNDTIGSDDNPEVAFASRGVYEFTYSVSAGCVAASATMTITVQGPAASITDDTSSCTYEISLTNPTSGTNLTADLSVANNSSDITLEMRKTIDRTCSPVAGWTEVNILDETLTATGQLWSGVRQADGAFLYDGDYITTLRIYRSYPNNFMLVNLNPTTSPYLTGVCGTVDANDLLYDGSSPNTFATAVKCVIKNAIHGYWGLTENTNYNIEVLASGASGSGSISIRFKAKNNPTTSPAWVGIDSLNILMKYYSNGTLTDSYYTNGFTAAAVVNSYVISDSTPCGVLGGTWTPAAIPFLDENHLTYNSIVPTVTTLTYSPYGSPTTSVNCSVTHLDADDTQSCSQGRTYQWEIDTGGGYVSQGSTTEVIDVTTAGDYRVTISCLDQGCSNVSAPVTVT